MFYSFNPKHNPSIIAAPPSAPLIGPPPSGALRFTIAPCACAQRTHLALLSMQRAPSGSAELDNRGVVVVHRVRGPPPSYSVPSSIETRPSAELDRHSVGVIHRPLSVYQYVRPF